MKIQAKQEAGQFFFFSLSSNHSPSHGSMLLYVVSTDFFFVFLFFSWNAKLSPTARFGHEFVYKMTLQLPGNIIKPLRSLFKKRPYAQISKLP